MLARLTYVITINISTHRPTYLLFIVALRAKKLTEEPDNQIRTNKPATYHHGDLRSALIDASVEMVAEVGADAFTLKGASQIAGVSVAAPYRHFSDKSELLHEVTEKAFEKMAKAMMVASLGLEIGTIESITALGQAYVSFAAENPKLFRLMCDNHSPTPDVSLESIFHDYQSNSGTGDIGDLLDINSPEILSNTFVENAPNQGIACFSILLKSVAKFLNRHNLDIAETLTIATPMWSIVHGTAFLLIDKKFENLAPTIDTNEMVATTTRYYLRGLLQEKSE